MECPACGHPLQTPDAEECLNCGATIFDDDLSNDGDIDDDDDSDWE